MKKLMKRFCLVVALFLAAPEVAAQEPACATQIQTANAMMEELQQQVRLLSARAAQHYGRAQILSVKLDEAKAEVARLNKEK